MGNTNQPTQKGETMTTQTKTNEIHWLRFNEHEDEAQHTGLAFQVQDDDTVSVWYTFRGYPEWEEDTRKELSKAEARKLYRECLDEVSNWSGHSDHVWEAAGTYNRGCGCSQNFFSERGDR